MEKITGGEYGKLIERFEALTTSPDGLLGQLEEVMDTSNAKRMLSKIFKVSIFGYCDFAPYFSISATCTQMAYHHSKEAVIASIKEAIEALFVIDKDAPRENMEDASRGYGRLLHASGSKTNHAQVEAVTTKVCHTKAAGDRLGNYDIYFSYCRFVVI